MPSENQPTEQVTDELRFRSYRSLSRLLAYVTEPGDITAAAAAVGELEQALAGLRVEAGSVLIQAKRWLATGTGEEVFRRLRVDYTRLFINAYPKVPAPPYGSVYLDGGHVWGQSTTAALKMYQAYGLDSMASCQEPPDHIGAELEFMAYLTGAALDEAGPHQLVNGQKMFFQQHLGRWFGVFFNRVQQHDAEGFYGSVAAAARPFLEKEAEFLAEKEGGGIT